MKKTIKAWAIVTKRGRMLRFVPDNEVYGTYFMRAVFPYKSDAKEIKEIEERLGNEKYKIVPVEIKILK